MVLGAFAKRVSRVLIIVFGLLFIALNVLGWLGNHR